MHELDHRVHTAIATGGASDQFASLSRLMHGVAAGRFSTIGFELAGPDAVAASLDDDAGLLLGDQGTSYLVRQLMSIAGGTTEMARNAIAERVLGMPRETSLDRGVPFRDVRHGS